MIIKIEDNDKYVGAFNEWMHKYGLQYIKSVKERLEKRGIDKKATNSLDAVENFWGENNFYYTSEDSTPLEVIEKGLTYFKDARRTKYEDSEIIVQELLDRLKQYFIEDKDIKLIEEINKRREEDFYCYDESETITAEEFFDNIDYKINEMELLDRYTDSNHEKEISIHQCVKDTVERIGISDSYVAQVLYKRMKEILKERHGVDKNMPSAILGLEMYRCVIKQSMGTKDEILEKFRFQFSE